MQAEPTAAHYFVNIHFLSPAADGREPEALICCCFRAHRTGDIAHNKLSGAGNLYYVPRAWSTRMPVERVFDGCGRGAAPLLRMN
jgi:hypothetical protein